MLSGHQLQAAHRAILDVFTRDEFEGLLHSELGLRPELIVGRGGTFSEDVFELLLQAERAGWTRELIQAVYRARPQRVDLAAIYQDLGLAPPPTPTRPTPAGPADGSERPAAEPRFFYPDLWREQLAAIERRVCRVELNGAPVGTGFLVGPDVILTAYHVVESILTGESPPSAVQLRFDYRVRSDGRPMNGPLVGLHPTEWRIDASPYAAAEKGGQPDDALPTPDELDYALLRLDRPVGAETDRANGSVRGWVRVPAVDPFVRPGDALAIFQHPHGEPLKLSLETKAILAPGFNANRTRLRYTINTDVGSGGAPCFDGTWNLVAVHQYSHRPVGHQTLYRQGVPIAAIRDRLTRVGRLSALGGDMPDGGASGSSAPLDSRPPEPSPIVHADDPQSGRWGGEPERSGRRMSVELLDASGRAFSFNAIVESTDGTPLEGPVFFHLHDTFPRSVIRITKIREQSRAVLEEVTSYGVFTIGVQVKDGRGEWVGLEYDLSALDGLPPRFKQK